MSFTENLRMDGAGNDTAAGTKWCPGCRESKVLGDFYNHWKSKDGKQSRCSRCVRFGVPKMNRAVPRNEVPVKLVGALRPVADFWGVNGRRCTACQRWKVWAAFGKLKTGHMGYAPRCRECVNQGVRSSRSVNLKRRRRGGAEGSGGGGADYRLRRVTRGDIEEMAQAQDGRCAACGTDSERLEVDCDVGTGQVRELLCGGCLVAVRAVATPGGLRALLEYLDGHGVVVRLDE